MSGDFMYIRYPQSSMSSAYHAAGIGVVSGKVAVERVDHDYPSHSPPLLSLEFTNMETLCLALGAYRRPRRVARSIAGMGLLLWFQALGWHAAAGP